MNFERLDRIELIYSWPPKRKQAATAAPKQPTKRRSKLAKENDITADQEAEIQDAFALFARQPEHSVSKEGVIATGDIRRCLIALNAPPKSKEDLQELLEVADPGDEGWVPYERFVAVAAIQVARQDDDPDAVNEEVVKAYNLFTKGGDRPITLNDLKRIAKELREDVPDAILKDMVREATGGGLGGVGLEEFEGVMRRAGMFG